MQKKNGVGGFHQFNGGGDESLIFQVNTTEFAEWFDIDKRVIKD